MREKGNDFLIDNIECIVNGGVISVFVNMRQMADILYRGM